MYFEAVLFDLDGTLLEIDLDQFFHEYFALLGPVLTKICSLSAAEATSAVLAATDAMMHPHIEQTNEAVFNTQFLELTGTDLSRPHESAVISEFYATQFPSLRNTHVATPGARAAYDAAKSTGAKVVLATNPIFPRAAIAERARWADFDLDAFNHVTTYENSNATKPAPEYYEQIAEKIGCDPARCLMVGDDAQMDLPASSVGMKTFYVGSDPRAIADASGSLNDLATLLRNGSDWL